MKKFSEYLVYPGLPLLFILLWALVFAYFCDKEKQENAGNASKSVSTQTIHHRSGSFGYGFTMDSKGKIHYGWGMHFGL